MEGRVTGVGPNGGLLRVGMGPTIANTEADSNENHRALALVTKHNDTERTDFSGLKPGEPKTVSGPLEWAAIKSKYFVTAVLALDSTRGRISGATATAPPTAGERPEPGRRRAQPAASAQRRASATPPTSGRWRWTGSAGSATASTT